MKYALTLAIIAALVLALGAEAVAPLTTPFYWLTAEDREIIERVVMAEARGESLEGCKAVAQVIFHRLLNPRWPNTVREVVKGEFAKPFRGTVSDKVRQAVHEIFDRGLLVFETEVYFFLNPRTSSRNGAAWQYANTTLVAVIGSHEFRR